LAHAITDETILVSIMHANNETGVIQPINEIGKITKERGVILHVDAAQSCGKIDVNVEEMQADLLSFSAHKMYGPKGIGALFVRKKNPYIRLEPCMHGGGHEHSMRSGTLNVPGVLAFAKACEVAQAAIKEEKQKLFNLQSFFWQKIQRELSDVALNGHPSKRLPNTLNISFGYVEGEAALKGINEKVAVSSGSACSSAVVETSYVLKAMQVPTPYAHTAIRFSLGRFTTQEEVSEAAEHVIKVIKELRKSSPIYQVRQQGIQGGFFAKYEEVRS